ncbi:MAG TPA: galactose oxidase-like domain-containing protein [Pyrinomonadaceae bacterium]
MSATKGAWGTVFSLPNAGIHTSVLPNGLVLMWGRRDKPTDSLDDNKCTPFLWNPKNGSVTNTPQPKLTNGETVNLFCSGHAFLPDGRLLVAGGHIRDGEGANQASLYDWASNTWTATAPMNAGRWYPTLTTLPDGGVLVLSGSFLAASGEIVINDLLQVWRGGRWLPIINTVGAPLNFIGLPLYPRMHLASDGRVLMSGTNARTFRLKSAEPGEWTEVGFREMGARDYCPAVMYDVDKVIYIGGGNDEGTQKPTAEAEVIDLSQIPPRWRKTAPMRFPRRQHNATLLPDGTVLVTGGTRGSGFNDLSLGQPVHVAELWNPATETWTELAAEQVDRCYHATTVLLPDARVLSVGGGEFRPDNANENDPKDTHRNGQVFSPPYLFKGARPVIEAVPTSVLYGQTFEVSTSQAATIGKVSLVRLPSVTHSFDQNQRINFLQFQEGAGKLKVTAPDSPNACPPGHYMLFILSKGGVPSVAKIIGIQQPVTAPPSPVLGFASTTEESELVPLTRNASEAHAQVLVRRDAVVEAAKGTAVVVGITGTCPYGIAACWGGAYEALGRLEAVDMVNPIPNASDSTAEVFLKDERLPALDKWDEQFRAAVNGTYILRGVEVTLRGHLEERAGELFLLGAGQRPIVALVPLAAEDKVQWHQPPGESKPLEEGEAVAYERLSAVFKDFAAGQEVTITGPLKQSGEGYKLQVRLFMV